MTTRSASLRLSTEYGRRERIYLTRQNLQEVSTDFDDRGGEDVPHCIVSSLNDMQYMPYGLNDSSGLIYVLLHTKDGRCSLRGIGEDRRALALPGVPSLPGVGGVGCC